MSILQKMLQVLGDRASGIPSGLLDAPRAAKHRRVAHGSRKLGRNRAACPSAETLESRLAMAIEIFTPSAGTSVAPWAVITSDNHDDVYVQQVASAAPNLLVADNASFNNSQAIVGIDSFTTIYATNGTRVNASNVLSNDIGSDRSETYLLSNPISTVNGVITTLVSGSLSYAGSSWNFTNNGSGAALTVTPAGGAAGSPLTPNAVSGRVNYTAGGNQFASIQINWSSPPAPVDGAGTGVSQTSRITDVTYTSGGAAATAGGTGGTGGVVSTITTTDFNIAPTASIRPTFSLPVTPTNPGGIVPGTFSGSLRFLGTGAVVQFRTNALFPPIGGSQLIPLTFAAPNGAASPTGTVTFPYPNSSNPTNRTMSFTGTVNYETAEVAIDFSPSSGDDRPGPIAIDAGYAVYNQDAQQNQFTIAPGQTFSRDLYVQLLTPGSSINVNSPVIQAAGLGAVPGGVAGVTFDASNINLNAQIQSANRFDVGFNTGVVSLVTGVDRLFPVVQTAAAQAIVDSTGAVTAIGLLPGQHGQGYSATNPPRVTISGTGSGAIATAVVVNGEVTEIRVSPTGQGSGYDATTTVTIDPPPAVVAMPTPANESLTFNAAVTANAYSMNIADDLTTPTPRGRLFVSASGSLLGPASAAAGSVYVTADTSDIVVEGTINATRQSYLLQSQNDAQLQAPYVFTTASPLTGANTGLLQGGTVGITLGNDLDTPEQGSIALNTVNLRTRIDSLRVTAATRKGDPLSGPFPYDLTIQETGASISFDAVAASSGAIALSSAGSMFFKSALATYGDLTITAQGDFTVSAPLSSTRGRIACVANSLAVTNSIQSLDAANNATRDDITLTATGGDLTVAGVVTAVNNIRLVQRNKAGTVGKIGGATRLVARGVNVDSEGSVSLRTDVITLEGRAAGTFSIDELDDISIPSLRAGGLVTLRANGVDPGADSPFSPNAIALKATLLDVTNLDVSAPRGSIDVTTDSSKPLTVGNPAAIAAGTATSMQAAGNVSIRSLAGPVTVADAPVAGGNAIPVRFAFLNNLQGTYSAGVLGLSASTLTGGKAPLANEDGLPLRVGDRVLLANQTDLTQNGVYAVTVSGSAGRAWVLTRPSDADTSGEIASGTFVRVWDGAAAGSVFGIGYDSTFGQSPLAVRTVQNRADAEVVRVATTSMLPGSYDPDKGTISGTGSLPLIDGVALSTGDRVLVRLGANNVPPIGSGPYSQPVSSSNGVYEVKNVGGVGGTWLLSRAKSIDSQVTFKSGYVRTTEGTYRAAVTGQAFAVRYEPLGIDPMQVTLNDAGYPRTSIGTEDINDTTTFVVSSTAGSNDAAGSLGKMIALRQSLDVSASQLNPNPKVALAFSRNLPGLNGSAAGVIRLTQELPAISKAFALDGADRVQLAGLSGGTTATITIDGSRITTTRTGQPAVSAAEVNGLEFVGGSQSSPGVAGASVSSLTLGGFANGAAVKINGVNGILVNKAVLGRNELGDRLANKFGVLATGSGAGGTVSGTTIVGSTQAGIRVEPGAAGLSIVGTTVGTVNQGNQSGIELAGGATSVGIDPVVTKTPAIMTVQNQSVFNLPATISPRSLTLGQTVSGPGIASGTTVAAINGTVVTLSKPMTATGVTNGISFGSPARNTVQYNLNGIVLAGGVNLVTNTSIGNNVYSGVVVVGGVQQIGTSRKTSSVSNAIYANGRYGVEVAGLAQSIVIGNNFGVQGRNQIGNVDPRIANARAYVPNSRTRTDANGNFHAAVAAASTASRKPAWR